MRPRTVLAVHLAAMVLVVAACGSSGSKSRGAARTVDIDMHDTSFSPVAVTVPAGQPVRLVFHNQGKVAHDALVGDEQAQMDHEKEMAESTGGMHHGGGDAITVDPGKTGSLTHTFNAGDQLLIGCHEPGHYAAGMKVAVTVS